MQVGDSSSLLFHSDLQLKTKERDQLGIEYSALLNCHVSDLQKVNKETSKLQLADEYRRGTLLAVQSGFSVDWRLG